MEVDIDIAASKVEILSQSMSLATFLGKDSYLRSNFQSEKVFVWVDFSTFNEKAALSTAQIEVKWQREIRIERPTSR